MRSERAEMAFSPLGLGLQALHNDRGSCRKSLYLDAEREETSVVRGAGEARLLAAAPHPAACLQRARLPPAAWASVTTSPFSWSLHRPHSASALPSLPPSLRESLWAPTPGQAIETPVLSLHSISWSSDGPSYTSTSVGVRDGFLHPPKDRAVTPQLFVILTHDMRTARGLS